MVMFDATKFTTQKAKPLPIILLLDVSGSMNEVVDTENIRHTGRNYYNDGQTWEVVEGGTSKIQILNAAVHQMVESLAKEERLETEFLVSIITFGDNVLQHIPLSSASSVNWTDMVASGNTAMGAAFSLAKKKIEDKDVIPSRAYRPTIVLVSDGVPTDDWESPLKALITDGRSSKCFFMAMGIGEKTMVHVLESFISRTPVLAEVNGKQVKNTVFQASEADKIHEFFQKVSMSVTIRSKSQNSNAIPKSEQPKSENEEYW